MRVNVFAVKVGIEFGVDRVAAGFLILLDRLPACIGDFEVRLFVAVGWESFGSENFGIGIGL